MKRISVTSWYQGEEERRVFPPNGERGGTGNGSTTEMEFWPLEHPTEPSDEDRPVKCPMSESSAVNVTGMSRDRSTVTSRVRMESAVMMTTSGQPITAEDAGSAAARLYRKRHRTMTQGDIVIMPIMMTTTPRPPPNSACKLTVRQMLHQKDGLEP